MRLVRSRKYLVKLSAVATEKHSFAPILIW